MTALITAAFALKRLFSLVPSPFPHLFSDFRLLGLTAETDVCVVTVQSDTRTHARTHTDQPLPVPALLSRGQWLLTCYYYTVVQHLFTL